MPLWLITCFHWLVKLPWKKMLPYILIAAAVVGSFGYGFHQGNHRADVRIAAYEKQIHDKAAKIEKAQVITNTKIVTEYKDRIKPIYVEHATNQVLINTELKDVGFLTNGWIYMHNVSAQGGTADPEKVADGTPSVVTPKDALAAIDTNYTTVCRQNAEQLTALQTWIANTQANINKANK